jgi:ABC-type phosphate/phosphonate transport system substrate-binding protein
MKGIRMKHFGMLPVLLAGLVSLAPAAEPEPASRTIVLAVSEGTSGGIDAATAKRKYAPMAQRLSEALGARVEIEFVREFARLEAGMREDRFDLVIARPSDYPARGLRDYRYQFVATAKPEGQCMIAVKQGSAVTHLADLKSVTVVMPEKAAYMTRFCRAALRDEGVDLDKANVYYVREQGAIPFAIDNGIAGAGGMASYSGALRTWRAAGGGILFESRTQPYMPMVASARLSQADVGKVQQVLTGLSDSASGRGFLEQLRIDGFVTSEEARLRQLLDWLGV